MRPRRLVTVTTPSPPGPGASAAAGRAAGHRTPVRGAPLRVVAAATAGLAAALPGFAPSAVTASLAGAAPLGLAVPAALALAPHPVGAQEVEPPTLTPADYGRWERLGTARLSPEGGWVAYGIARVDEDTELRIRRTDGSDSARVVPWGGGATFSTDGRWLAYSVGVSPEERERLEEEEEPVRQSVEVLELESGETRSWPEVEAFGFAPDGRYLALRGYPPDEPRGKGADLRVVELATGTLTSFGNVGSFAWSDEGPFLAMALATGRDDGNGVQLFEPATGRLRSLDASGSAYRSLTWREDGTDLAVLRSVDAAAEGDGGGAHVALAWRDVLDEEPERLVLEPGPAGVPDSLEVVAAGGLRWSEDGAMLALGLRPAEPDTAAEEADTAAADTVTADSVGREPGPGGDEAEASDEEPEPADVQIWHSSDVRIIPRQEAFSAADGRRTLLAVWHLDDSRVVVAGSDLDAPTDLLRGWEHVLERISEPYPWGAMFGRPYHDVWLVDTGTGAREQVVERVRYSWSSEGGGHVLTFDGADFHAVDVRSGESRNLTAAVPAAFADTAYDAPTDVLPPHGVAGWTEGDRSVLLYDEFDVWRVDPTGAEEPVRLTRGAEDEVVHRLVDVDDDEEPGLDPDETLYLSLHGKWSKRNGYARLEPGGTVERAVWLDRSVAGLQKADSAEVFLHRVQGFEDSPDLFVSGPGLESPRRLTTTNPFQADFAWGRSELVDFTSETGRRLQAALYYPADYRPGRRYPTIVYTYEILSPRVHDYAVPGERSYYNFQVWTQRGYAVLLPDIVYRARDPGLSALEAVRPAVEAVVEMGVADPERVGLVGHSWGGYQATFLPTRTDLFAASVAGAPLTDFVSMMGSIHWNPGLPEVDHWETGQARMEVPFWEDPEAHRRNSPIHRVQDLETPLLMAFGNEDGVVDWDQGTEFYNFARRAGKQMVLLVYEGEDHGFRQEKNQRDYHRRILEWFGHYLKGDPAPAWITEGVPLAEMEDEARRVAGEGGGA